MRQQNAKIDNLSKEQDKKREGRKNLDKAEIGSEKIRHLEEQKRKGDKWKLGP